MFVTVLQVDKNENAALYAEVLKTCQYCAEHDANKDFLFTERPEGGIKITSPGKNQAFRRGGYFHAKHGLNYEVYYERETDKRETDKGKETKAA